jgi:opacity protein-like surface antigen
MRALRSCVVAAPALLLAASAAAHAQAVVTPYIDTNVAGEVETARGGLGVSLAYYVRGRIGLEVDAELHRHFFRDADVAHLVGSGDDLDTRATILTANVVAPYCFHRASIWCPYAVAGLGMVRTTFETFTVTEGGGVETDTHDDLAFDAGLGVMHALTDLVGLRLDARYIHAFVDGTASGGGFGEDFAWWRVSVGITVSFPQSVR